MWQRERAMGRLAHLVRSQDVFHDQRRANTAKAGSFVIGMAANFGCCPFKIMQLSIQNHAKDQFQAFGAST